MGIQQALVTVTGNLGADPVPFTTSAGVPACSFRLAVTPRFFDQSTGQWRDRGTSWVGVCAYRALSKNILGSLNKGDPVIVSGTMRVERWQKDGADRVTPVIDASAVGPDLSQGIARLNRISRNQTGTAGADGAGGNGNQAEPGGGQDGAPSNNPLNPPIPANPAANAGGAPGVVIDTSGVIDGQDGGGNGVVDGQDGDGNGVVDGEGPDTATVDPSTGELPDSGEFGGDGI